LKTAERLAEKFEVSSATVRRDGEFAAAVDSIAEACGEKAKQDILAGRGDLTRQEVVDLFKGENPADLKEALQEHLEEGSEARPKGKRASKAKDKKSATASTAGVPDTDTITLPTKPSALANALVEKLGRTHARQVHRALDKVLKGGKVTRPK
jgi:hypothetical protein